MTFAASPLPNRRIAKIFRQAAVWSCAAFYVAGSVVAAPGDSGSGGFAVAGVAGPSKVLLTKSHPALTKPVTVVIANLGAEEKIVPDAATLRRSIGLRVVPSAGIAAPAAVLAPRAKFPLTLRPQEKISVVFRVRFELGDASPGVIQVRYSAALAGPSVELAGAASTPEVPLSQGAPLGAPATGDAATSPRLSRPFVAHAITTLGADKGATVTAKPLRVPLKKDASQSEPITLKAAWPGKSFYVSGWECTPADGVASPILEDKQTTSVTVRWGTPGDYVVTAYLIHFLPGGGFEQAAPSELVHVVKVEFKDENGGDLDGAKVGITTAAKNRAHTFRADVFPSTETQNVTLKLTKGQSALQIKDINPMQGQITFKAEGIGTTGSKSEGDCEIEAQLEGKTAATGHVTVILPSTLLSAVTTTAPMFDNTAVDRHSIPPSLDVPEGKVDLYTFYFVNVRITVGDQFKQPLVSSDNSDYLGAAVGEIIKFGKSYEDVGKINQTIQPGSFYDDPVGTAASLAPVPRYPIGSKKVSDFKNEPNPIFPLAEDARTYPVDIIRPTVDGFQLKNVIRRVVSHNMGLISVDDQIQ